MEKPFPLSIQIPVGLDLIIDICCGHSYKYQLLPGAQPKMAKDGSGQGRSRFTTAGGGRTAADVKAARTTSWANDAYPGRKPPNRTRPFSVMNNRPEGRQASK
jgi:hypothetical protein